MRYWGVQRTPGELEATYRSLLPSDSMQHGLVGWWTMEEGRGQFLDDATESRYRIRIERGNMRWATQDKTGLEPPTPQHRERLVCPIELRRARLVQKARTHLQLVGDDHKGGRQAGLSRCIGVHDRCVGEGGGGVRGGG